MIYQIPVTSDALQEQTFKVFDYDLRFTLRYNAIGGVWNFDLFDRVKKEHICLSEGLAVSSPALMTKNLPFVVVLLDTSGYGINPIEQSEMGQRLQVLFMSKEQYREKLRASD